VQVALLALNEKLGVGQAIKGAVVLLLLDLENVGGALDASEKILAVITFKEFGERFHPANDHQQIILPAEREHGIDQVVTCTLVLEIDLEAVGEERSRIVGDNLLQSPTKSRFRFFLRHFFWALKCPFMTHVIQH